MSRKHTTDTRFPIIIPTPREHEKIQLVHASSLWDTGFYLVQASGSTMVWSWRMRFTRVLNFVRISHFIPEINIEFSIESFSEATENESR